MDTQTHRLFSQKILARLIHVNSEQRDMNAAFDGRF